MHVTTENCYLLKIKSIIVDLKQMNFPRKINLTVTKNTEDTIR